MLLNSASGSIHSAGQVHVQKLIDDSLRSRFDRDLWHTVALILKIRISNLPQQKY
jgi:hypothetical protein